MTSDIKEVLVGSDFFAGLDEAALENLALKCQLVEFASGEQILEVGQPAERLFVVASGTVALGLPISRGGESRFVGLQNLGPGKGLSWSALVQPYLATLSARTREPSRLVSLEGEWLRYQLEQDLQLRAQLYQNLLQVVGTRVTVLQALVAREMQRWIDAQA